MGEYDIYLNGIGFHLAKDRSGNLVSGAARMQIVDPFTRQLSANEAYTRIPFRFGDGAGLSRYDGSSRYEWGNCIDTRSGRLILAPEKRDSSYPFIDRIYDTTYPLVAEALSSTGTIGLAERFQAITSMAKIRSVAILVKRDPLVDYTAGSTFTIGITDEVAGPKPGATLASATATARAETDPWLQFPDRWRNSDWFWLEATFTADATITPGAYYWIFVYNNQPQPLHFGELRTSASQTRSAYSGGAWSNGASDYPLMFKLGNRENVSQYISDSFPRCFCTFRGVDNVERLHCGTGNKIMVFATDESATTWANSRYLDVPVLDLAVFNSKMFVALGHTTDMQYTDGTSATTVYTVVTGQQSNAFAIHDNMLWKADWHAVNGSVDGTTTWTAAAVNVGDPGTPVQAMTSHGGKLFAAKPEGIFEISYPDTYPATGTPTANLMLDFSSERCPRTWLLDWHSGLYFPGMGGVYELKGGVLRNLWEDKVDENAQETTTPEGFMLTRPRSWAPLYDSGPVAWTSAHGTTRGILFARSNPHTKTSELLWYDGRNWHAIRSMGLVNSLGAPLAVAEYATACFVHDVGGGRGWLWTARGFALERYEWPTWTDDTVDDGAVDYEPVGMVTTPWYSLDNPSRKMLLGKAGVLGSQWSPGHVDATIYYRLSPGSAWTELFTADAPPYEEADFPAGTTARSIQFMISLATDSAGTTPVVEQLDLMYQTLPDVTHTHQLIISCSPDQELRSAGIDERTAGEILADLVALVGSTNFTYIDPLGTSHTVRVTALTGQVMTVDTAPGPAEAGIEEQVILNLLEV